MFSCSAMSESNCCECWDKFYSANFVQTFEMSWTSAIWAFGNGGRMKENLILVNHVVKVGSSVVNMNFECSFVMYCQNVTCVKLSQSS